MLPKNLVVAAIAALAVIGMTMIRAEAGTQAVSRTGTKTATNSNNQHRGNSYSYANASGSSGSTTTTTTTSGGKTTTVTTTVDSKGHKTTTVKTVPATGSGSSPYHYSGYSGNDGYNPGNGTGFYSGSRFY